MTPFTVQGEHRVVPAVDDAVVDRLTRTTTEDLETLKSWFPDRETAFRWGGPGLRYPFTHETFIEDIRWPQLASCSLTGESGELLAFGQYYEKYGRCHLARLAVAPDARGQGIGSRFIRSLMQIGAADLETTEYSLFVLKDNPAARACYRSLGFRLAPHPSEPAVYPYTDFMVKTG